MKPHFTLLKCSHRRRTLGHTTYVRKLLPWQGTIQKQKRLDRTMDPKTYVLSKTKQSMYPGNRSVWSSARSSGPLKPLRLTNPIIVNAWVWKITSLCFKISLDGIQIPGGVYPLQVQIDRRWPFPSEQWSVIVLLKAEITSLSVLICLFSKKKVLICLGWLLGANRMSPN
jgi:hypothetical protein